MLLYSTDHFDGEEAELTLLLPINIKKNIFEKAICPKCKKSDEVYKFRQGKALVCVEKTNEHGDTLVSPIYKHRYYAGNCIVGIVKYYCDRDKVKF